MKVWGGVSIICGVILVVGAVIIAEAKGDNIMDQVRNLVSAETVKQEKAFATSDFSKVEVRTSNGAVEVRRAPAGDDHITVSYGEPRDERWRYNITDTGSTLVIEKQDKGWMFFQLFSHVEPIVIQVPEGIVLDFDIKTSNGAVMVSGVSAGTTRLETSNGRIEVENVAEYCPNILFIGEGQMECETILDVKTSNGRITLNGVVVDEITGRTSNGGISFEGLQTDLLDLKTSNGGIDGSVDGARSDFSIKADTSNGSIRIGDGSYGKHLTEGDSDRTITLKTSNGGIQLNFAN